MPESSASGARRFDADPPVALTGRGFARGVVRALPVALSTIAFGMVLGVLARRAGLSVLEVGLMSGLAFTGSGQLVAIRMWETPLPDVAIVSTTLLLGLRHVLMGLTLQPWFSHLRPAVGHGSYFLLTDESWGLCTVEFQSRPTDAAFLIGAGSVLYTSWVTSTALGSVAGGSIPDPSAWGLDFALAGVFISLLVSLVRGSAVFVEWCLAAAVAIAADRWLPGNWYVLLGATAGSLPALLRARP